MTRKVFLVLLALVLALSVGLVACGGAGEEEEEEEEEETYDLTIASTGGGLVMTPGEGTFTYDEGTVVDLVAQAEQGYQFVIWSGDVGTIAAIDNAVTSITVDGDYAVTAEFAPYMIAAGEYHTLGLKPDGSVVAVGDGSFGRCNVGGWTDIVYIAAGGYHSVGVKSDGTVVAVGRETAGQINVDSWTNTVQVAAGEYHTVGLKSDGTVVAVGRSSAEQLDVGDWTDIVQVVAGGFHTVSLKSDGTVVATGCTGGFGDYGQCEVGGWMLK